MQIGMIGLGRMGANMVRRLLRGGHECVVNDRSPEAVEALLAEGATGATSLDGFIAKLKAPRTIWMLGAFGVAADDGAAKASAASAAIATDAPRKLVMSGFCIGSVNRKRVWPPPHDG